MRRFRSENDGTYTLLFTALIIVGVFFWSFSVTVDGTEEAVFNKKPLFFGTEGIEPIPLLDGRAFKSPTTSVVFYSVLPNRYDEVFNDLLSSDKVMVDFTASITLSINRGTSPQVHRKFGADWYKNNAQPVFLEYVRSFAKDQTGENLMASSDIVFDAQTSIQKKMTEYLREIGLDVTVHRVTIGKATPNLALQDEMDNTAAQRQRSKTELERKMAEDARMQAEQSKATADKAYMDKFGMSIDQYLQLRNIEIEMQKLELVKSKNNVQILMMSGNNNGAVVPTYDVRNHK